MHNGNTSSKKGFCQTKSSDVHLIKPYYLDVLSGLESTSRLTAVYVVSKTCRHTLQIDCKNGSSEVDFAHKNVRFDSAESRNKLFIFSQNSILLYFLHGSAEPNPIKPSTKMALNGAW